jgi:RNA polymerase sigma-54 factor
MSKLKAEKLVKRFRGQPAVNGVSLELSDHSIVGLLGPNGAGKTTIFYMIAGLIRPDEGKVSFDGEDVTNLPMHKRARKGITYLPQEPSTLELLDDMGLSGLADQQAQSLSGGERRRVEVMRALATDPSFILLDEPFAGVDPLAVSDLQKIIQDLKARGIGVFISDHNVRETLTVCDRAYIVNLGVINLEGTPEVMTPQLQQAIKLLQLSQVELIETIDQELEINPVLEESESEAVPSSKDTDRSNSLQEEPDSYETQPPTLASSELEKIPWEDKAIQDINWKDFWDEDNRSSLPAYSFEKKETQNYENLFTRTTDLREHLTWQLQMTHFNDIERQNACLIIGNLDRNGYLKTTIEEIAEETECSPEKVEDVLKKIQLFDPVGVAARDLKECLLVQMDHLGINDSLVCELVSEHLNLIERHNYQAMAKATGQSLEEIARAIEVITALEPCPGRQFSSEEIQYIVPDIYVYKVDDEYVVTLNDEGMPRLRISSFYRDAIKNGPISNL